VGKSRSKPDGVDAVRSRTWLFVAWLVVFYAAWLTLVIVGKHSDKFTEHWAIGLAMAIGSYFAGSTPMGGGTVGFPVLVLIFGESPAMGRDFSFAIQSIGMVSAAILIFCMRQPVEKRMLKYACIGATLGTPAGLAFIAPHVPGLYVKLIFAVTWASFGMLHFAKIGQIASMSGLMKVSRRFEITSGFTVGLLAGATIASTTGVGIDLAIYVVLVLMCRADLKIAIPTSVVLMAYTSVVGIVTQYALSAAVPTRYEMAPGVLGNWIVAAPVVALGAPFGVIMVRLIPRKITLLIVSGLCMLQLGWTYWHERHHLTPSLIVASVVGLLALNLMFMLMHDAGKRRAQRMLKQP